MDLVTPACSPTPHRVCLRKIPGICALQDRTTARSWSTSSSDDERRRRSPSAFAADGSGMGASCTNFTLRLFYGQLKEKCWGWNNNDHSRK